MELLVDQIGEVLHPLYADPGDSGIDSDGNEQLGEALQRFMAFVDRERNAGDSASEASSSGDEAEPPVREAHDPPHWGTSFNKSKDDDFLQALEDGRLNPLEVNWPMGHRQPDLAQLYDMPYEEQRASPPLYEVELTASDEDDDGSVLELVIPMQSSRYKRVPTASPKKQANLKKPYRNTTYGIFCCMTCLPSFG